MLLMMITKTHGTTGESDRGSHARLPRGPWRAAPGSLRPWDSPGTATGVRRNGTEPVGDGGEMILN